MYKTMWGLTLLLCCVLGWSQSENRLWQAHLEREQLARQLTFEYEVSITQGYTPRGAPADSSGAKVRMPIKPFRFSTTTSLTLRRTPQLTIIETSWPVYNAEKNAPDWVKWVAFWSEEWVGALTYDAQDKPYTFEVSRTSSFATKHMNRWGGGFLGAPEYLVMLGGESLAGLYKLQWQMKPTPEGDLALIASNPDDGKAYAELSPEFEHRFEAILSRTHSAPVTLKHYPAYTHYKNDYTVFTVKSWRKHEGYWFPEQIIEETHTASRETEKVVVYQLKAVRRTANLDLNQFLPEGTWVADYRHRLVDAPYVRRDTAKPVQYRWQGRLLSLAELEQLAQDAPPTRPRPWGLWVSFIAATALLLTGVVWYARTRKHA